MEIKYIIYLVVVALLCGLAYVYGLSSTKKMAADRMRVVNTSANELIKQLLVVYGVPGTFVSNSAFSAEFNGYLYLINQQTGEVVNDTAALNVMANYYATFNAEIAQLS